jgi:hypothetical protein
LAVPAAPQRLSHVIVFTSIKSYTENLFYIWILKAHITNKIKSHFCCILIGVFCDPVFFDYGKNPSFQSVDGWLDVILWNQWPGPGTVHFGNFLLTV